MPCNLFLWFSEPDKGDTKHPVMQRDVKKKGEAGDTQGGDRQASFFGYSTLGFGKALCGRVGNQSKGTHGKDDSLGNVDALKGRWHACW